MTLTKAQLDAIVSQIYWLVETGDMKLARQLIIDTAAILNGNFNVEITNED